MMCGFHQDILEWLEDNRLFEHRVQRVLSPIYHLLYSFKFHLPSFGGWNLSPSSFLNLLFVSVPSQSFELHLNQTGKNKSFANITIITVTMALKI